nr:hypothetical protein [Tanacetum cinerariifolium]
MKLDGEMKKEEEEAIIKVKGEPLIEKEDPKAFVIPIQIEANINLNALADTGSDINVMPYHVYMELGREEMKPVNKGITMLNHSKAEPMRLLRMFCARLWEHMMMRLDPYDPNALDNMRWWRKRYWNMLNQMGCGEVIDEMLTINLCVACIDEEIFTSEPWNRAFNIDEPIYSELCHEFYSTYEFDEVYVGDELRMKNIINFRLCERAFSCVTQRISMKKDLMCTSKVVCVAMITSTFKSIG